MENVTHTLVGFLIGESSSKLGKDIRSASLFTAIISSNIPDIDIFLSIFSSEPKLHYLLTHRGYTHTFIAMPIIALISGVIGYLLFKPKCRFSFLKLFFISLIAALTHLFLDYGNNYGVHPFYPFNNNWFYGDAVFILEPIFWFTLLPFVIFRTKSIFISYFWMSLGIFMLTVLWLGPFSSWHVGFFATIYLLFVIFLEFKFQKSYIPVISLFIFVISFFHVTSFIANSLAKKEILSLMNKDEVLYSIGLTPNPSNPFCWEVIAVFDKNDLIVTRKGNLSIIPTLYSSYMCRLSTRSEQTAVSRSPFMQSSDKLGWRLEMINKRSEFVNLKKNCRFKEFMKFSRFPFLANYQNELIAGDHRYDRQKDLGFSEISLDLNLKCFDELKTPWEKTFKYGFE